MGADPLLDHCRFVFVAGGSAGEKDVRRGTLGTRLFPSGPLLVVSCSTQLPLVLTFR